MLPWPWKLGVGGSGIAPPLLHQGTRQSSQFSTSTFRPGKAGSPSSENLELIFENNFSDNVVITDLLLPPPTASYTFKYFRWILQPCPAFYLHQNVPHLLEPKWTYMVFLFNCKLTEKNEFYKKMRWDICKFIISDYIFSTWACVFI